MRENSEYLFIMATRPMVLPCDRFNYVITLAPRFNYNTEIEREINILSKLIGKLHHSWTKINERMQCCVPFHYTLIFIKFRRILNKYIVHSLVKWTIS